MFQGGRDPLDPEPLTGQWDEAWEATTKSTKLEIPGELKECCFSGNCGGKGP